jgi:arylsulfatase A-like enzyme
LAAYLRESNKTPAQLTALQWENVNALYDGEVRYTDEAFIGPLISQLKKLEMYDRTMIVLTSDHGEEFNDHGGHNHGHSLYNELIHIPLIVKFPGTRHAGKTIDSPIGIIDIMPMILSEVNIDLSDLNLDGRIPDIFNSKRDSGHRPVISELYAFVAGIEPFPYSNKHLNKVSVVDRFDKTIFNKISRRKRVTEKNDANTGDGRIELFDLKNDFSEQQNLYLRFQRRAKKMVERIKNYYREKHRLLVNPESTVIDQKLLEQLRALGYIN